MESKTKQKLLLGLSVVVILSVIFYLELGKASPTGAEVGNQDIDVTAIIADESRGETETTEESSNLKEATEERLVRKQATFEPAKEISTPDGFINVEDISIEELIGEKIILVDFWTYSCINCQRTLPFLNDWHEKYADDGLVILGLHTPEFEFEKDYDNVARAVEKWGVQYPVILDNDYSTWRSYKNRYWPRKYLIDIDGFIVYDHIGEGAYDETEEKIVALLNEKNEILGGGEVALDETLPENVDEVDFRQVGSPETYLGSSRLERIANLPSLDCISRTCEYTTVEPIVLNSFQLEGRWTIKPEEVTLEDETGSIFYRFRANKVNLVVGEADSLRAKIYLNGKLIESNKEGTHVENSIVTFTDADLYNLVDQRGEYSEHLLEIRFLDSGIDAFAFTFG